MSTLVGVEIPFVVGLLGLLISLEAESSFELVFRFSTLSFSMRLSLSLSFPSCPFIIDVGVLASGVHRSEILLNA